MNIPIPKSKPIAKFTITYTDNIRGYKILKSPIIKSENFVISAFAPGTHKIALTYCNNSTSVESMKKMFNYLWNNNSPAVVEVGIVNGSCIKPGNLNEITDFLTPVTDKG